MNLKYLGIWFQSVAKMHVIWHYENVDFELEKLWAKVSPIVRNSVTYFKTEYWNSFQILTSTGMLWSLMEVS